jgi:hypothetical protein
LKTTSVKLAPWKSAYAWTDSSLFRCTAWAASDTSQNVRLPRTLSLPESDTLRETGTSSAPETAVRDRFFARFGKNLLGLFGLVIYSTFVAGPVNLLPGDFRVKAAMRGASFTMRARNSFANPSSIFGALGFSSPLLTSIL